MLNNVLFSDKPGVNGKEVRRARAPKLSGCLLRERLMAEKLEFEPQGFGGMKYPESDEQLRCFRFFFRNHQLDLMLIILPDCREIIEHRNEEI